MAPKRPVPTHNTTPSAIQTRQKAKKTVSTSAMFAQIPKLRAAQGLTSRSEQTRVSVVKQPQTRRMVAVVIPRKEVHHPLMREFNDSTTSYTTDLLSSASSKLVSIREHLLKRLDMATPESLLDPSIRNLRVSLAKPLLPTPAILFLRELVEKEERVLLDLKKEHGSLNSSIGSLVSEILQTPSQVSGKEGEVQGGRYQLHQVHMAKVKEISKEISMLGAEEVGEMEVESKNEAKRRAKIAQFFMALDEDDE